MTIRSIELGRITDESTPFAASRAYVGAGFDPIPIHGLVDGRCTCGREDCDKSRGKHPVGKEWETRAIHASEFTPERNVGLRMGGPHKLIAIDLDGSLGIASLAALETRLGALPPTLTSESGSGGRHLLFTTREIEKIRNSAKRLGPNVDVRSGGGQIVVAPSRHQSGGRYRWHALHDVAELPEAWEAEILRLNEPPRVETPALDAARGPGGDRRDQARRYIATMPAAIAGQGGHAAAWAVACKLVHGFELSDADALAIMAGDYNPRCEPLWSAKELDHKIASARAKAHTLSNRVADREWRPPAPWAPDDAPIGEPPDWAMTPEDWEPDAAGASTAPSDLEPDPVEAAEREAIAGEPSAKPPERLTPARNAVEILTMAQLLAPVYDAMKTAGAAERHGIPTGVGELDMAIGGYRAGNVTILGAKRSFGKTSFSLLSIDTALAAKCEVIVFACEDSPTMYGRRFMARRSGVNATLLRDMAEPFTGVQMQKALDAFSTAENVPFFVNAIGMPVEQMAEIIASTKKTGRKRLVVVDYLQCIRARRRSPDRRIEVTHVAQTLSAAIKNADDAGLLLSQLKRTEKRRPEVEDLKESGDLEDAAEHILLGHRDASKADATGDKRLLIIGKNKDGCDDVPDIELRFSLSTASFTGMAPVPRGQERDPREPPLGRSWSARASGPVPRPHNEAAERDDVGEGLMDDGFGGLPRA